MGSATSTVRTPEQTATALFIAPSTFPLVSSSLRDLAARHRLVISDSARLFAAVAMSGADAAITAWDSKLEFGYWRPVTAIQLADTDGNPDTLPDPGWLPLIATPPYPDYTGGLTTFMGPSPAPWTAFSGFRGTALT